MKKLLCMFALLLAGSAQAQVQFESGSARPINPGAAMVEVPRHVRVQPRVVKPRLVRCRDGSRRTLRQCKRYGGGARR